MLNKRFLYMIQDECVQFKKGVVLCNINWLEVMIWEVGELIVYLRFSFTFIDIRVYTFKVYFLGNIYRGK